VADELHDTEMSWLADPSGVLRFKLENSTGFCDLHTFCCSVASRASGEDSPRRNRLEASAARRELGFIIADVGQQQRVLHRHAAGHFDELDKLLDTQRFLISGARAASRRETIRRGLGLNRSQRLGARSRRITENERRRKRKSSKEAAASHGQGGLLILVLKLSISRVSLSEGSLRAGAAAEYEQQPRRGR